MCKEVPSTCLGLSAEKGFSQGFFTTEPSREEPDTDLSIMDSPSPALHLCAPVAWSMHANLQISDFQQVVDPDKYSHMHAQCGHTTLQVKHSNPLPYIFFYTNSLHAGLRLPCTFYSTYQVRLAITSSLQLVFTIRLCHSVVVASHMNFPEKNPSRLLNNITTLLDHNWKSTCSLTKLYEYYMIRVGKTCPEIYGALGCSAPSCVLNRKSIIAECSH